MKNILPEDWKALKEDAYNVISGIDVLHMNDDDYVMLGASLAILDHKSNVPMMMEYPESKAASQGHPAPSQAIDYVPGSRIDELKQESLQHFMDYMQNKSLEQLHNSKHHGAIATDYLRKMLKVDEEIVVDLYRAADEEEREHIKESYKKVLEDMK